ncbi:ankyrin repeat domain-containing protein [Plantactinospora sp. B5E13]|uniref:ankyrin repeat domain-containing protein n=1 Tax=Plantactinospora sp. B5E13 TaxID=3153758 RepID=UPI00325D6688
MNARKRKKSQKRLMSAVVWGTSAQVARLLRGGADPNQRDRDGSTLLYRASVQGNAEIVRVLLAAGAGVGRPVHREQS